MRILLVEDEIKTGDYLKQGLSEAGYITDWVTDGISGKHQALFEEYDLIILDVMLPKLDGWTIISDIRKSGKSMPILFLSARDQIEDRVKGLELGADDYLVKPFAFAELLARIKSLLRRGQQKEDSNIITIADLELDLRKRRVTRAGHRIDLTAKEFALMELFMRRRGEILPRTLIASQIWDMNFDSDTNVVEVAIKRLRNKIDSNFTPKLIQNIRGMGYVLEVEDEA
ncbi:MULTISPECIES: heavy metal response regulator transcription factor [Acinetobacter]|jgi:two-component system copper resistance phosphate regulon response regulator CusR|uniref:Heavy metal response regulator transcription factor n=1 Tax=Acinetobacter geminorum TaxID=2730922 RepID=A0ABT8ZGW7_9GAMM|nr:MULTISPECIES: heavy metal response regulator transcription factor [Acinetobacter]MBJ8434462.1 heavy metal response regulator transcription factor [Acinetobacter pittii]MBJ9938091.1 heavy metal response regulator transcription factor [Acinetobacter pittii]MBN6538436.1 heavy metal response regulator transcription factor [Acinetobacter pittii]MCU4363331.1 heavy metal response regulator transcription factor [Acinetobacter sp. WU_MDCI_Abxc22]MDO7363428.1 heavy metal response regulator transcript